jgi:hypothetical protein
LFFVQPFVELAAPARELFELTYDLNKVFVQPFGELAAPARELLLTYGHVVLCAAVW